MISGKIQETIENELNDVNSLADIKVNPDSFTIFVKKLLSDEKEYDDFVGCWHGVIIVSRAT